MTIGNSIPLVNLNDYFQLRLEDKIVHPYLEENSAIYATRTRSLLQTKNILGNKVVPMEISAREGFDINTPEDLVLAERLLDPEIAENLSS